MYLMDFQIVQSFALRQGILRCYLQILLEDWPVVDDDQPSWSQTNWDFVILNQMASYFSSFPYLMWGKSLLMTLLATTSLTWTRACSFRSFHWDSFNPYKIASPQSIVNKTFPFNSMLLFPDVALCILVQSLMDQSFQFRFKAYYWCQEESLEQVVVFITDFAYSLTNYCS